MVFTVNLQIIDPPMFLNDTVLSNTNDDKPDSDDGFTGILNVFEYQNKDTDLLDQNDAGILLLAGETERIPENFNWDSNIF